MRRVETDHLVVGAGAMGLSFVDALLDHAPEVHVTLVDRRDGPGGHWRDAYPFVRLHQASQLYGVASTVLGGERIQVDGPEAGLHERAALDEILDYYDGVLRRHLDGGRLRFLPGVDHREQGGVHVLRNLATGEEVEVLVRRRVVDATYLSPTIPTTHAPPFEVDGARVVTNAELPDLAGDVSDHVVVGSGKTATDAIVWLLDRVDPDQVVWIRPRDPWMFNRAAIQPDPVVMTDTVATIMASAASSPTPDAMFLALEEAGVMLRVDRDVVPTMAKTPTLAEWELERLRTVERVVRHGHVRRATRSALVMDAGTVPLRQGSVVVHCAASGTVNRELVPIWQPDRIRLQTVRTGAPCFNGALLGYVEATRRDDVERNRLCPPNLYGNTLAEWSRMQARGAVASGLHADEPDLAAWADATTLNPGRVGEAAADPAWQTAAERVARHAAAGLARLEAFAAQAPASR